jgi:hypothetical protein
MSLLNFKTSTKYLLEDVKHSKSKLGSKNYLIYLLIYIVLSYFVLSNVHYFPDYNTYDNYIVQGTAGLRFSEEPLSAYLMMIVHDLNYGAEIYYISLWIISSLLLFITMHLLYGKRYLVFSTLIMLNPISIIIFQTPRQFLSYILFVLALIVSFRLKIILAFLALFAHTISGLFSFFLLFIISKKKVFFSFLLFSGLIFIYLLATNRYSFYLIDDGIQRGLGRLYLFLIFNLTLIFLSFKKHKANILLLLSIFVFTLGTYSITPYAGRLVPYLFTILLLYAFSIFNKKDSVYILHLIFMIYLLISAYIVVGGKFGYG